MADWITESTENVFIEVEDGRRDAIAKHGENSIEAIPARDIARWLPIFGEEFGEVCESLTYDKDPSNLRAELIDVITVATAWVAALDRVEDEPTVHDPIIGRRIRVCTTCGDEAAYCAGHPEPADTREASDG